VVHVDVFRTSYPPWTAVDKVQKGIPEIARTEVEKKSRITKAETKVPRYEKSMLWRSSELIRNLDFSHRSSFVSAFVILDLFSTSVLAISGIPYPPSGHVVHERSVW
jgi:hypothetical protein